MWEICGHILRSQRILSVYMWYPLVMAVTVCDIENDHRNSGYSH